MRHGALRRAVEASAVLATVVLLLKRIALALTPLGAAAIVGGGGTFSSFGDLAAWSRAGRPASDRPTHRSAKATTPPRQGALRRAVNASVVLATAALLLGNGMVGSTSALFNGETKNAGSGFAGGWIDPPGAATATATGYDMALAWTAGTHGPVTGQTLSGVDNGTNSNCTGAAYSSITTLSAATASYTDSSRGSLGTDGDWECYELVSTSATAWTATLLLPAVQLGLVATAVSIGNGGGTANLIQQNDTITITFNQQTNLTTANVKVCAFSTGAVLIGDQKAGNNCGTAAADGYSLARLDLTSGTMGSARFVNSTVALSSSAPWTATITLSSGGTATVTGTPAWKLTGSGSVLSNATLHQAALCSAASTTCQPTTATSF